MKNGTQQIGLVIVIKGTVSKQRLHWQVPMRGAKSYSIIIETKSFRNITFIEIYSTSLG